MSHYFQFFDVTLLPIHLVGVLQQDSLSSNPRTAIPGWKSEWFLPFCVITIFFGMELVHFTLNSWTEAENVHLVFYRVRQKYLIILQNRFEWNRWRGEFVLERSSSETQSISVAMERWSVEHRAFAVETYFKNDSVLTQRIFRRHFNIHRNECP